MGKDKYDLKFRYTLVSGKTPEQVLAEAEAALQDVRAEMAKLAAPRSIKEALDQIAPATCDARNLFGRSAQRSGGSHQFCAREASGYASRRAQTCR